MTELRRVDEIVRIVSKYGLKTLVETGCYEGDGIRDAFDIGLQSAYSCDISDKWVEHCRERYPACKIYHGSSSEVLGEMCQEVEGAALFWLDAHLPEMYGVSCSDPDKKMPVVEELNLIKQHKKGYERDVVIVDDTRIIKSDDNKRFQPDEIICCTPIEGTSIAEIVGVLKDTHRATHNHKHEGYIVFKPLENDD